MSKGDKYFAVILGIITFLGIFRGFPKPEKDTIYLCEDKVVDSTYIKPVFSILHKKDDILTGDVEENIRRYQQLELKTEENRNYNVTVIEVEFNNTSSEEVIYDVLKTKLILDDGSEIELNQYKSSPFTDVFHENYSQIGNLVFNTDDKNIKALKFPDGSVRAL